MGGEGRGGKGGEGIKEKREDDGTGEDNEVINHSRRITWLKSQTAIRKQ